MSQPQSPVATTPAATGRTTPQTLPGTVSAVSPARGASPAPAESAGSTMPRRLRLLLAAVTLAGLLLALVGCATFAWQAWNLSRAAAAADQLVRVQQIETNLLRADATATNAFLVGGLEPPAQRATYDSSMATATALVADAARAQPADGAALAALNQAIVDYTSRVEQARANNRQGLPVGAQYLRTGSAELRTAALPILANLIQASSERAGAAMDAPAPAVLFQVVGLLVLAGLVLAMLWLARTFRRRFNLGLLAATGVVLLALISGVVALNGVNASVDELQSGAYRRLTLGAQARIEANDAKANESLTLVARGSGGTFEQAWQSSATRVRDAVAASRSPQLTQLWDAYGRVHTQIRALDDGGRWEAAVARATGGGPDSANTRFAAFDTATTSFVAEMGGLTRDGLRSPRAGLIVGAVLLALAGIAAALLGRRGVAARLREYR